MRFRSTPTVVAVLATLLCATIQARSAGEAPPSSESTAFTVGDDGRVFKSADARGGYLAVHFLLATECPYCTRLTREYSENAPTIAGVRHVFVKNLSPEEFKIALKSGPNAESLPLYRDVDGALARKFSIPDGYSLHDRAMAYPALVLLDPSGKEVFRHVGKDNKDRFWFPEFAAKIARLTRDKESAEGNHSGGLELQGYDPVAYLDEGKAVAGDKGIRSTFRGQLFQFATEESRAKFNLEPAKYLPAYGGWCATAMAKREKVEIDPKSFRVKNGRVFLFYNGLWGNALEEWNKDEAGLTAQADANWRSVVDQK